MALSLKIRNLISSIRFIIDSLNPHILLRTFSNGSYKLLTRPSFQTRTSSSGLLLLRSIFLLNSTNTSLGNKTFVLFCDDYVPKISILFQLILRRQILAYSCSTSMRYFKKVILVPDFVFNSWPEAGITNYDDKCTSLYSHSINPIEFKGMIFWAGNTNTHSSRKILLEQSKQFKWLSVHDTSSNKSFVSLEDHCKYEFLIDIRGRGYSGRVKLLMFSGRALFLQDRDYEEWYYPFIKPYVHYIPVKSDLSDLHSQYLWALDNKNLCDQIALNAQEFAMKNLTSIESVKYLANIIKSHPPSIT